MIMAKQKVISFRVSEEVYDVLSILSGGKISEYMRYLTRTHTQHGLTIWGDGCITDTILKDAGMSLPLPEQPVHIEPIPLEEIAPLAGSRVIHVSPDRPRRVNLDHSTQVDMIVSEYPQNSDIKGGGLLDA